MSFVYRSVQPVLRYNLSGHIAELKLLLTGSRKNADGRSSVKQSDDGDSFCILGHTYILFCGKYVGESDYSNSFAYEEPGRK